MREIQTGQRDNNNDRRGNTDMIQEVGTVRRTEEEEAMKIRWVKNISSIVLTHEQVKVLEKGAGFAVTPKGIPTEEYVIATEMAAKLMTKGEAAIMRAEVTEILNKSNPPKSNLSKMEWKALRELKKKEDIVIMPAYKGRCMVVMDKIEYIEKMEEKLSDHTTYKKIDNDPTIEIKEKISEELKMMETKGEINNKMYLRLLPSTTQIPRMYGLPKIHKEGYPL